jgi:hypothetical protein
MLTKAELLFDLVMGTIGLMLLIYFVALPEIEALFSVMKSLRFLIDIVVVVVSSSWSIYVTSLSY